MSDNVTAEIIAIGTEILLGEITDTNSVYLAQVLRDYGINLYFMTSVGDNVRRIAEAVTLACDRADIVITCGGLGPTVDDMTRQGIALATHRELEFNQILLDQIQERFNSFRMEMPANNRRQAYLPTGSTVIENAVGTAPAFMVEHGNTLIVTLPGVPRELKYLMTQKVMPMLMERYSLGLIRARVLRAGGIGESALDELLGAELLESSNPTVGLAAHHGIIDIRITAKGDTPEIVERLLDEYEQRVRKCVGSSIFGYGKDTIEQVLIESLLERGEQLAILEAGLTGTAQSLQKDPRALQFLPIVKSYDTPDLAYEDNAIAKDEPYSAGVDALLRELGAAYGNAVVILSAPDVVDSADSEQATVVGIYSHGVVTSRGYGFGATSEVARVWAIRWGLANLWRMLKEQ